MISCCVVSVAVFALAYVLIEHLPRLSLSKIRGLKSSSFVLGNLLELLQRPTGQADFEWQRLYGDVVRFKTILGGDQLLVADPKALQYILGAYSYPKQRDSRVISNMLHGKGIAWADGEDHLRQKNILLRAFGSPESKVFLSTFRKCAESMCAKWMEIVSSGTDQKVVLNIPAWLSHGTLDAIGQAAFDTQNYEHPLAKKHHNMISVISRTFSERSVTCVLPENHNFGHPSAREIFIRVASTYIPTWILQWIIEHVSNHRIQRAQEGICAREIQDTVSKGSLDILSLLVKANMETEGQNKMSEEELVSQMCTILLAGHEPVSNTLSWILLELARHPQVQSKLRAEIRETETAIRMRGDAQFTMADFDAMPYMTAVIKEGLRYHPVVSHVERIAETDDILPLGRPLTTESDAMMSEIFVPKGTRITASIAAYNRIKELWGEDAHEFNPDRWLADVAREKQPVPIGVYANLMTFMGGNRACLGWRFAVIEIQTFLVEIISQFELTMTERSEKVCRGPPWLMVPVVEGEVERGSQMPLAVSIATREEETRGVDERESRVASLPDTLGDRDLELCDCAPSTSPL